MSRWVLDDHQAMTKASDLDDISAAIHDEYFHVDLLERGDRAVRLPVYAGRVKKGWMAWSSRPPAEPPPPPLGVLVVGQVVDVSVEDEAGTGWFGINGLKWEPATGTLRIVSNIPCEIVVRCESLDVEFFAA
jgi:hypothetical protein